MALVELAKFYNSFEAGIVQGRLESEGIDAVMFDLNVSMGEGVSFLIPVRLMVDEDDLDAARAILAEDQR